MLISWKELRELNVDWMDFCELTGTNEWARNEGTLSDSHQFDLCIIAFKKLLHIDSQYSEYVKPPLCGALSDEQAIDLYGDIEHIFENSSRYIANDDVGEWKDEKTISNDIVDTVIKYLEKNFA